MGRKVLLILSVWLGCWLAPVVGQAEMYVEGYGGFVRSATVFRDYLIMTTHHPSLGTYEEHRTRGTYLPAAIGGAKIGTWFTREGFLGADYPDWMKYFGVYLDFSYHRQDFRYRVGTSVVPTSATNTRNSFQSTGETFTLACMFAGRYGLLKDETAPFGRIQPYFGLGPALLITTQKVSLQSNALVGANSFPYEINPGAQTAVVAALAVEPGVRVMATRHLALDLSFKFRWAHPSFIFKYLDPLAATRESFTLHPQYLILSFQMGAAYHF